MPVGLHVLPDGILFEPEVASDLDVRHRIFRPAAYARIDPCEWDLELASNVFWCEQACVIRFGNIGVVDNGFCTQTISPLCLLSFQLQNPGSVKISDEMARFSDVCYGINVLS